MKIFLIVLLCLFANGCETIKKASAGFSGGTDNSEPPTPLTEFRERLEVKKVWTEGIGKGSDKKYLKLTPKIENGAVYIVENRGEVNVLDAIDGKKRWDAETENPITGGPGINQSIVLVGTQEGEVLAFNAENGEALWSSRVSSEILAAPKIAEDTVVARTIDGKIFGIDADTGDRLWVYDRTVPALTLRGTSAPVIDSGLVIAGFDGGRLAALELDTGKLLWETRIAQGSGRSELDRIVDIDAEPIIDAGVIYVATFQGNVAAVELETGTIQWAREISSHAGLGLNDDLIFVTDENSHIWALDRFSGSSIWKQEQLQARAVTAPTSIGEFVVVGDLEGYLHWMDAGTGDFVARNQIDDASIIATPIAEGNLLYAYSSDGTLGAYSHEGELAPEIDPEEAKKEAIAEAEAQAERKEKRRKRRGALDEEDDEGLTLQDIFDIFSGDENE